MFNQNLGPLVVNQHVIGPLEFEYCHLDQSIVVQGHDFMEKLIMVYDLDIQPLPPIAQQLSP